MILFAQTTINMRHLNLFVYIVDKIAKAAITHGFQWKVRHMLQLFAR